MKALFHRHKFVFIWAAIFSEKYSGFEHAMNVLECRCGEQRTEWLQ